MTRTYYRYLAHHYGALWFLRRPLLWRSPSARLAHAVECATAALWRGYLAATSERDIPRSVD